MRNLILLLSLTLCSFASTQAQPKDKADKDRLETWPPLRTHTRFSLGYALQEKFKLHTQYCGFNLGDGKRDYVPQDITRFIGKRTLRTKVETADIRGGGLFYYIFKGDERQRLFQDVKFSPSYLLRAGSLSEEFALDPDKNFDAFLMTKNCSGYLKAALDAGIEPPYAAFKTALDRDERRQSTVVGLCGSFISPLRVIFQANDARTTEAMLLLWKFYTDNPSFVNNAYYLREFEGVLLKHIATAEENAKIEAELGVNFSGPLSSRISATFGRGKTSTTSFTGTDWETIVFADFDNYYTKEGLFEPLPSPADIRNYFDRLQMAAATEETQLMTEGAVHQHELTIAGIPEFMTEGFWEIKPINTEAYEGMPALNAKYYFNADDQSFGCNFTVTGKAAPKYFQGPLSGRPVSLSVAYQIRSKKPVGGEYLSFYVNELIQTSAHPIVNLSGGAFDLSKKEDRRFALQWKCVVNVDDKENPVDYGTQPYVDNIVARRRNQEVAMRLTDVRGDAQKRCFYLVFETAETFPLDKIDDANMSTLDFSFDLHLKSSRSGARTSRSLRGDINLPTMGGAGTGEGVEGN